MHAETRAEKTLKAREIQRSFTSEHTYERVIEAARALGVTRVADITGIDRIGIPTYSATVPDSGDILSVYAGKGLRPIDAKVGAIMEAIERQVVLKSTIPAVAGTYQDLSKRFAVVDPRSLKERLVDNYSESATYEWVIGRNLFTEEDTLVPAGFAGYFWYDRPYPSCFETCTSSGLAAGNIREEAICQALCELIERDAWTLAEMGAQHLPWLRRCVTKPISAAESWDDFEFLPSIDLEADPAIELYHRANLYPVAHDITSDIGIPTVFAAVADDMIVGFPMVHFGVGTHPDARIAARRALTEAAQSRCIDIQGVREDIAHAGAEPSVFNRHTRRVSAVNRRRWFLNPSTTQRSLSDLPSFISDDIQADLDHILVCLRSRSIDQVIVVDFTPEGGPFSVVRVIVPALESWSIVHGSLGQRAVDFWRSHV